MGADDLHACFDRIRTDAGENDRFALLIPIYLIAGFEARIAFQWPEALGSCLADDFCSVPSGLYPENGGIFCCMLPFLTVLLQKNGTKHCFLCQMLSFIFLLMV